MFSESTKQMIVLIATAAVTVLVVTPLIFMMDAQHNRNKKALEAHVQKEEQLIEVVIIGNGSETSGGYKRFPATQSDTTLVELPDGTRWKVNEMIGHAGEKVKVRRWQLSKQVSSVVKP